MFKEAGGGQLGLKVLTPVPFSTRKQKLLGKVSCGKGKRFKQVEMLNLDSQRPCFIISWFQNILGYFSICNYMVEI